MKEEKNKHFSCDGMKRLLLKKKKKNPSHRMMAGCWDYPARGRKSTGNKKRIDILNSKDGMLHFGNTIVNVLSLVP